MKTSTVVSAGGVITDGDGRIALTARRSFKGELQWGLPKGHVEDGETIEAAAAREASEETGFEVEIIEKMPTIDYWFVQPASGDEPARRIHKFVHYFLMRVTGGDPSKHDAETEEVALLDADEALTRASFDSEKELIMVAAGLGNRETPR